MDAVTLLVAGDDALHEVADMPYLERDGKSLFPFGNLEGTGDEVQVGQAEVMTVLQPGVPAVRHEHDVLPYVLLDDEPGAAPESQPLPLADGVEPVSAMRADDLSRLDVDDASLLLSHKSAQEIVVVYLAQEADALAVLPAGRGQSGLYRDVPHLLLHQVSYGEERVLQLVIRELGEEVRLVLHGVLGRTQENGPSPRSPRGGEGISFEGNVLQRFCL